ncbi:MAG: MarR family transcriptional regulator [Candidatus Latescibacteria bacterium]|nr:MarR family transcriptional regulator [Candidatus Latescibacterota bacterium]
MTTRLKKAVKPQKPAPSLEHEVFLNLQQVADGLLQGVVALLKPAGLSPAQYNVLRILRGAGPDGLACRETAERMITRDPDMTRLLDRLEARGLVSRSRNSDDRRVLTTRITEQGLQVLQRLDEPIEELHTQQLAHLTKSQLHALAELLELVRTQGG